MSSTMVRDTDEGVTETTDERLSGSEWDSMDIGSERVDDRDLENIDLDIECWNEALERKAQA